MFFLLLFSFFFFSAALLSLRTRSQSPPSKNNIVRVCVKASRAEGPRRLHTNTAYAHLWGLSRPSNQTSPADVVNTRLTRNKPSKTTRKMTQSPEKAMEKLTPMPDLLPLYQLETQKKPGSTGTEVGANSFLSKQSMTSKDLKHQKQLKIPNLPKSGLP